MGGTFDVLRGPVDPLQGQSHSPPEESTMSAPDSLALTGDHGLGTVRTMPQFRSHIEQGPLTDAQRQLVLDQAEALIEELYVHLPLKRAMHAVDPLQALRLVRHRLAELTETEFHVALQRIFLGL